MAMANVAPQAIDLDAVTKRFDAIDSALRSPASSGLVGLPGELLDRLAALERSLAEERAERLAALTSLASDVKALISVLGSTPDGPSNQPSITERLRLLGEEFEQHREALSAQTDKFAAELAEVGDSVTKLNVNQQLLAGSMDQWRSNDAGEIHLINTRIGAIQEDGTQRLQMLERLASDIEALAESTPAPPPAAEREGARSFRQWLLGTEDWIKASWQKRSWF
jgi:hypothetical protein